MSPPSVIMTLFVGLLLILLIAFTGLPRGVEKNVNFTVVLILESGKFQSVIILKLILLDCILTLILALILKFLNEF